MAMTTIDLRESPSKSRAADVNPIESFTVSPPQSPHFEIPTQLWVLFCIAGALILVSTMALFLYGQVSIGI